MKKAIGAVLAAAILATSVAPGTAFADDRGRHYERRYDRHHDGRRDHRNDDAVAAGVVGLALGAILGSALTSSRRDRGYYEDGYYRDGPYRDGYYGDRSYGDRYGRRGYYDRPRTCIVRERRYDRYYDRPVIVERRVPC